MLTKTLKKIFQKLPKAYFLCIPSAILCRIPNICSSLATSGKLRLLPITYRTILHPFFLFLLLSFFSCSPTNQDSESTDLPNILLIISDDQGWTDYSFMGHPHIQTPRIDRLGSESFTFTRGYVTAPLCSPSLASMMSGLYPHQHGVTGNDPLFEFEGRRYGPEWMVARKAKFQPIQDRYYQNKLLTQYLNEAGYLSLQTGKWWMGSWEDAYFTTGMTHGDPSKGGRHGDEGLKIGREGLKSVEDVINESQESENPFFIWYAPFLPHSPHTPPDSLEQKYLELAPTPAVARYWAMCEWFDITCGQILDMIEERGMTDNTLVIYVCDNGWIQAPERNNRYAPRSKRTPYEYGIRTPIMYKWPGMISPNMDTITNVSSLDILPTILAAIGQEAESKLPGVNMMDTGALKSRKTVFAENLDHDIFDTSQPNRSLLHRIALEYPWKLIVPDTTHLPDASVELFNVLKDPHEQNNVAGEEVEIVNKMKASMDDWWTPEHLKR